MSVIIPSDAVAIGVGAFFGAMSRYQVGRLTGEWIASDPNRLGRYQGWHTAAINVTGSFILGGVTGAPTASWSSKSGPPLLGLTPRTKLLLGVGFCGSFTTFSTYSVDIATWIAQGQATKALSYVMANNGKPFTVGFFV
jgi:fluoride exporter